MKIQFLVLCILFVSVVCPRFLKANEINLEKNNALFISMFGEEYDKIVASKSKLDDEKFALDLIANAAALSSKPELQIYIKFKAAELLVDSDKSKKLSRDLFIEVNPDLPDSLKKEVAQKIFELQKKILVVTPKTNKNVFAEEVEIFVSSAQILSNYLMLDSDYSAALTTLREPLNFLTSIDKDAAGELNKKIASIQKESNRFLQISSLIDQLKTNPKDEKINQSIAEYYLFERNSFYMAWPYLENTKNEVLKSYFNTLKLCLLDETKITTDGLSLSLIPLLAVQPKYFLNWLSKLNLDDPTGIIKEQTDLINSNKKIQTIKVEALLQTLIETKGDKQNISHPIYMGLANDIASLIDMVSQNKKLDAENAKYLLTQFYSNKYIALSKANIKLSATQPSNEVDKLKMELELGKVKNKLKELEISEFTVEIATLFLLQQKEGLLDKIDVSGGGTYTFDLNSWNQFNKDFEILVDNKPLEPSDKKSLFVQNGLLVINESKKFNFNSKKMKWNSNIEISFEVSKDYEPTKQALDFYLMFKPASPGYRQIFGVFYAFFMTGGWFGVIKDGEGWETFTASKLCKGIGSSSVESSIWKTDKVKVTTIIKDNKIEITLNDESILSAPLSDLSKEKGFPNTPIQMFFTKRYASEGPVKIDNLYIGPPRIIKKK